jgi:hypothetical protein
MAVLAVVGASSATWAAGTSSSPTAQHYLQAMDDVPLMVGLADRPVASIVFETAAGRIIEAEAVSRPAAKLAEGKVMGFYEATLAELGWRSLGRGRFAREDEILSISTGATDKGLWVKFSLRPK